MMEQLKKVDPAVYQAIMDEMVRQRNNLELIASENFVSAAVLEAQGSVMTNKYAEGLSREALVRRAAAIVDCVEQLAIDRAKELFGADHVNVQPHSGSQANNAVYSTSRSTRATRSWPWTWPAAGI